MRLFQKQILILIGLAAFLAVLIFLFYYNLRARNRPPSISLTVWGFDKPEVFDPIIQGYRALRPNVTIEYKQVNETNYEDFLLNALASGQGPDVFPIHNRSLPKNENKLYPVDSSQFNLLQLRNLFPQVVEDDFVPPSSTASAVKIYALPLSVDTLALIYNKDLFNQASIVSPPATWNDFQNIVPRLRSIGESGQLTRAAAAIGGSEKTIATAVDILNNLMLENGTPMASRDLKAATFAREEGGPGIQAFNFYLQFASPLSSFYTWNDNQQNALESFSAGKTAMIFDYHSALTDIRTKSPFLNFSIAPMPQAGNGISVNYADYSGFAVSKQSTAPAWAWDFIVYFATNPDAAKIYLAATNQPPALRALIAEKLNDPELSVFAAQSLTARSWYEVDEDAVRRIFNAAIAGVLSGKFDSRHALENAQDQITQLMQQR